MAKVSYPQWLRESAFTIVNTSATNGSQLSMHCNHANVSSNAGRSTMAIVAKLSIASLIAGWITLVVNLPRPIPGSQQQATPTPSTDTGKQQDTPAKPVQPQPNPDASGKYHVGDGVSNPKLIDSVPPERSVKLLKKKTKTPESCIVSITVDIDGSVKDVHILTSTPDIGEKNCATR